MTVAAILLAAGRSRRFEGGDKLLSELAGEPLILRTARALAGSAARQLVVVTASADLERRAAIAAIPARHVFNDVPGQAASLAAAIAAVEPASTAAVVLPADMPLVTSDDIDRLIAAFNRSKGDKIVYCLTGSAQRPPVLWPSALFPALSQLTGDTGGKGLISAHPDLALPVTVADADAHRFEDVDTRRDLLHMRQRLAASPTTSAAIGSPRSS